MWHLLGLRECSRHQECCVVTLGATVVHWKLRPVGTQVDGMVPVPKRKVNCPVSSSTCDVYIHSFSLYHTCQVRLLNNLTWQKITHFKHTTSVPPAATRASRSVRWLPPLFLAMFTPLKPFLSHSPRLVLLFAFVWQCFLF